MRRIGTHHSWEKIGREWARDNSVRRIDTSMLQQWGEELRAAKKKGPSDLDDAILDIGARVDRILS